MPVPGYADYQRREFCKDLPCPIQVLLDQEEEGGKRYERIRRICQADCLHTTYEFHHWLIEHGYEVVRPEK